MIRYGIAKASVFVSMRRALAFIVATLAAGVFASLPVGGFKDRAEYIAYAQESGRILAENFNDSWLYGLLNEPLWLVLNIVLSSIFDAENVLRIFIFFGAFVPFLYAVYRAPRYTVLIVFLSLSSYVLTNHIHHIRMSVGVSVFLIAMSTYRAWLRLLLLGLTPFVHVMFFPLLAIYAIAAAVQRYRERLFLVVGGVLIAVVVMLASLEHLTGGARQVEHYLSQEVQVGGGAFLVWGVILLAFVTSGKEYVRRNVFEISIIVFFLGLYFVFPYTRRFLDAGIWLIIVAGLSLPRLNRYIFVGVMSFLTLWDLSRRIQEPGWGL